MRQELTDEFLRRIIDLKRYYGYQYAPEIARAYERPVATVHRWIGEARRRGLLEAHEHQCACRCGRTFDEQ